MNYIFILLLTFCSIKSDVTFNSCLRQVYAPPLGVWGQEVALQSCFGDEIGCKFSVYEKTGDVPVRYQVKADQGDWKEYKEGDFIKGQTIKVRATTANVTGVGTTIKAECSCECAE